MPNRILRDWTDSLRLDGITAEAERLFVRLIMKADDYGRFHADPRLVKSGCFPLSESLRANDLVRWLDELSHRQLILRYEVGTRSILMIRNFGQRLKLSRAKFPPPPGKPEDFLLTDDEFRELPGTSGNFPSESDSESETAKEEEKGAREASVEVPDQPTEPPPGWPATDEEAGAGAAQWGVTPEVASRAWLLAASRGWCDSKGVRIRSWPHHVAHCQARERDREGQERNRASSRATMPSGGHGGPVVQQPGGAQLMVWDKELTACVEEIARINRQYDAHMDKSDGDRAQLKKLKQRAAELKAKLGRVI